MTLIADKKTTNLVKKFFKKNGLITIPCQFDGFGECVVRFVSVSESDKWNYKEQKYSRMINFEIIMSKSGHRFSEDRIPSANYWGRDSRQRFFKNRKYMAQLYINQMLTKTKIPLFFDMATITRQIHGEMVGNITYKYI